MSNDARTVSEQIERLALAGFVPPSGERLGQMVDEWGKQLARFDISVLEAGIDYLIARKKDRWWPTLAEVLDAVRAAAGPLPERSYRCQKCDGTTWVDAAPFKSGGEFYSCVQRCPDCRVPNPRYDVKPGTRQPLSAAEQRANVQTRTEPPILTEAQFFARLKDMGAAKLAAQLEQAKTTPRPEQALPGGKYSMTPDFWETDERGHTHAFTLVKR